MLVYIALLLLYIVAMFFEDIFTKTKYVKFLWSFLLTLPLFILAAFRAPTVGTDTFTYYQAYQVYSQQPLFFEISTRLEPGYVLLMRLIGKFGFDYFGFQVIIYGFMYLVFCYFIFKHSPSVALSLFIVVATRMFFDSMNIVRQFIALAIILCAIKYVKERSFLKFSLYVLIASLFHVSAIVCFVLYPLAKIRLTRRNLIYIILVSGVSSIFFDFLIKTIVRFIERYSSYITSEYFNMEGKTAVYFNLAVYSVFFIVGLLVGYRRYVADSSMFKGKNQETNYENIWFAATVLTLAIGIIGTNATIMNRIIFYFSALNIIYIPVVLTFIRNIATRFIVKSGIIVGLFIYFLIIQIYRPEWNRVVPYIFYWNWVN